MSQQQTAENHELSSALYEELAALKIRIAFAEISEDEFAEFESELALLSNLGYSEHAQRKTLKEIQRRLNRRDRKHFARKTLPQVLNVISVVFLLFFFGLTTATATVRPVRLKLLEFIALIEDHYSAVSLDYNDNDNVTIPSEWKGEYYPFYIPGEYAFESIDDLFNSVRFTATGHRVLEFCELGSLDYANFDLGSNDVFDVEINGNSGIAKVDSEGTTITWSIEETYFYLYFSGDLNEAQQIAGNVQRIH